MEKQISFITPVGTLTGFIAMETPSVKFDPAGVYSTGIIFEGKDADFMQERIDRLMELSLKRANATKQANAPYKLEDGILTVSCKQKATITARSGETFEKKPKLYDADNKPVDEVLGIGAGTLARLKLTAYMWNVASAGAGVTLQPQFMQIAKLVKYQSESSDPFGEAIDGDFKAHNDNVFDGAVTEAAKEEVKKDTTIEDDFDF